MVVVHGQVHAAAGDAGLVREDGERGLVLAVVPPVRARRRDAGLDARAPDPRLDDVRVVAVEARGADERAVAVRHSRRARAVVYYFPLLRGTRRSPRGFRDTASFRCAATGVKRWRRRDNAFFRCFAVPI